MASKPNLYLGLDDVTLMSTMPLMEFINYFFKIHSTLDEYKNPDTQIEKIISAHSNKIRDKKLRKKIQSMNGVLLYDLIRLHYFNSQRFEKIIFPPKTAEIIKQLSGKYTIHLITGMDIYTPEIVSKKLGASSDLITNIFCPSPEYSRDTAAPQTKLDYIRQTGNIAGVITSSEKTVTALASDTQAPIILFNQFDVTKAWSEVHKQLRTV